MAISLAWGFHAASVGSIWHGRRFLHIMTRRKAAKPRRARHISSAKSVTILSRLHAIGRRPITIALAIGFAAAFVGFSILRNSENFGAKPESASPSRSDLRPDLRHFEAKTAPVVKGEVIAEYDHDLEAFTQGLVFHDGFLYESTGLTGKSSVRKVDLATGQVVLSNKLRREDFGEGLALIGNNNSNIVQVIWKVGKAYVYDRQTLREISSFSFQGDGWGLASRSDGSDEMFLSDGTSVIKVMRFDGNGFRNVRTLTVRDGSREVGLLNELEIIGDELWANVWMSDFIARIDINTGAVKSWIDLRGILRQSAVPHGHTTDVLNGIAYDPLTGAIYVTGKQWPKLYRISPNDKKIASDISTVTNAFFLNPDQVAYVHKHVIA